MKFATTFLLLSSLIVALPSEDKKETTPAAPCFNALVCKIGAQKKDPETMKKLKECESKKDDAEKAKCTYSSLGFKDDQVEKIAKLQKPIDTCATPSETSLKACADKCTDDKKKEECVKECATKEAGVFGTCVAKAAGKPDFDLKDSGKCSSECKQDSLSDLFACDYKCNKELYDALTTKSGDDKEDKDKEGKDKEGKDKEEKKKEEKPKEEKDKSGNSSAMSNFGMSSFGAMAVGTVLSALLI
jgi:hypothetical protein